MTTYEFLLQLGFWQWIGVLMLSGIAAAAIVDGLGKIMNVFRRKP